MENLISAAALIRVSTVRDLRLTRFAAQVLDFAHLRASQGGTVHLQAGDPAAEACAHVGGLLGGESHLADVPRRDRLGVQPQTRHALSSIVRGAHVMPPARLQLTPAQCSAVLASASDVSREQGVWPQHPELHSTVIFENRAPPHWVDPGHYRERAPRVELAVVGEPDEA